MADIISTNLALSSIAKKLKLNEAFNLNGTIEGIGGPILGIKEYTRVIFIYYRKGTKYNIQNGNSVETKVINNPKDILSTTPISKIEVRYVKKSSENNMIIGKQGELLMDKDETIMKKINTQVTNILNFDYIPLGIANQLGNSLDNYMISLLGDLWNKVPVSLKPIIVRNEQRGVSCNLSQAKRVLDDNNDSMIKEAEYYNVSKKQDTLTVSLFSVKSNLVLDLFLKFLEKCMDSQKTAQSLNSVVVDGTTTTFPDYKDYPEQGKAWDKSNSKYLVKRIYLPDNCTSYLLSYINDGMFFFDGKLSSYNVNPNSSGDGINITFTLEKIISEEEAWLYEKQKGNKNKNVENEYDKGELSLIRSSNHGANGICKIGSTIAENIAKEKALNILYQSKGNQNYIPIN